MDKQQIHSESQEEHHIPTEELLPNRTEVMQAKRDYLGSYKEKLAEVFGMEQLPKELVAQFISIRRRIAQLVEAEHYIVDFDPATKLQIYKLFIATITYKESLGIQEGIEEVYQGIGITEDGSRVLVRGDGTEEALSQDMLQLLESLELYFETYKIAKQAYEFQKQVQEKSNEIREYQAEGKFIFTSREEVVHSLARRLQNEYAKLDCTREEWIQLIEDHAFDKELNDVPVEDIDLVQHFNELSQKYIAGERSNYLLLSLACAVPGLLSGYSHKLLSDGFNGDTIEITQVALYVLASLGSVGSMYYLHEKIEALLTTKLSEKGSFYTETARNVGALSPERLQSFTPGGVRRRVEEALDALPTIFKALSYDLVPALAIMTTSFVVLLNEGLPMATGTVAGTGILIALNSYIDKKSSRHEKESQTRRKREEIDKSVRQLLDAHTETTLSGESERVSTEYEKLAGEYATSKHELGQLRATDITMNKLREIAFTTVMGAVSYLIGANPKQFVFLLGYSTAFQNSIKTALMVKREMLQNVEKMIDLERMTQNGWQVEQEAENTRVPLSSVSGGDIVLHDVKKNIGSREVLKGGDVVIPEGGMVELTGPSGVGKSTLLKLLAGYERPTAGNITFGDQPLSAIKKTGTDSWYQSVCYMSQFPYIFEGTVRENLLFGVQHETSDQELHLLLKKLDIGGRFANLYEKLPGGRAQGSGASGGESARLAFARLFLRIQKDKPRVVFLDEPTAALDSKNQRRIAELLMEAKQLNPQTTFIIVSHSKEFTAMLSVKQRIMVENGVVRDGTPKQIEINVSS